MSARTHLVASLVGMLMLASAVPAMADGPVIITHAKALAGNVTPGDSPGYPVSIRAPGSYQLGSNLHPGTGKNGIEISGGSVALDFNGFTLAGSNKALNGIVSDQSALRIRNGVIADFKNNGIKDNGTGGVNGDYWTVQEMTIIKNGGYGIYAGYYLRLLHSTVAENGYIGVRCVLCHIEGNIISSNDDAGAQVAGGTVLGNEFEFNKLYGLWASGSVGYGNNHFAYNAGGDDQDQVTGTAVALHPNTCNAKACP